MGTHSQAKSAPPRRAHEARSLVGSGSSHTPRLASFQVGHTLSALAAVCCGRRRDHGGVPPRVVALAELADTRLDLLEREGAQWSLVIRDGKLKGPVGDSY